MAWEVVHVCKTHDVRRVYGFTKFPRGLYTLSLPKDLPAMDWMRTLPE